MNTERIFLKDWLRRDLRGDTSATLARGRSATKKAMEQNI
jgi:hypothetical protein